MRTVKAMDLCAGAGGWACAAAGLPVEIVAAVDFWEPALRTYGLNWPATRTILGDVRDPAIQGQIERLAEQWKVQLLLGAIPCQWLSLRRNIGNAPGSRELQEERRTLRAVLGLVERIRPRWWCLEDVKGLVKELPPGTPWIQLDSADFSAQSRKRIYVGEFPRPPGVGPLLTPPCQHLMRDHLRPGPFRIGTRVSGRKVVSSDAFSPSTVAGAYPDRKSPTLCCLSSRRDAELVVVEPSLPGGMRQLEWQEAARLQGFPEEYLFYGSPTDVWEQIGQAIQIDTGHAILAEIVREAGLQEQRQ